MTDSRDDGDETVAGPPPPADGRRAPAEPSGQPTGQPTGEPSGGAAGPTLVGDRYELGPVIGYGGMAEVHRGVDTRLGRTVAIKLLRASLAQDETFQERFRREATASASLNHPCIISVYDTGDGSNSTGPARDLPYIVMEFVEGRTLRDVLRAGRRILPERALEITAGILSALDYSHRMGIVHRDIKPANVMLTPSGEVKVMDFGIARAVEDTSTSVTQTAAVIGTAQYLSPEQARGELVGPGGDIYSVGCVLYELLTGRPPFTGTSPVALALAHVRDIPDAPGLVDPEVPAAASAITMCALAKDPGARYPGALAMREDIERALAGRPVWAASTAAGRAGTDGDTGRVPGPRVWPPAAAGATAAAGGVAGAALGADPEETGYTGPPTELGAIRPVDAAGATALRRPGPPADPGVTGAGFPPGPAAVPSPDGDGAVPAVPPARPRRGWLVALLSILGVLVVAAAIVVGYRVVSGGTDRTPTPVTPATSTSPSPSPTPPPTPSIAAGVQVPDVTGRTQDEARSALTAAGLAVNQVTMQANPDVAAGRVVTQTPSAGSTAPADSSVDLVLSNGPAQVAIPDVTNTQQQPAVSQLDALGLRATAVGRSSNEAEGTVLSTDPAAGQQVAPGSAVTVNYANGRNTVVDTVGKQADVAQAQLAAAGFGKLSVQPQPASQPAGTVLDQAPRDGTYPLDTQITLFVAAQPSPSPSPSPSPTPTPTATGAPSPASTPTTSGGGGPPASPTPSTGAVGLTAVDGSGLAPAVNRRRAHPDRPGRTRG